MKFVPCFVIPEKFVLFAKKSWPTITSFRLLLIVEIPLHFHILRYVCTYVSYIDVGEKYEIWLLY